MDMSDRRSTIIVSEDSQRLMDVRRSLGEGWSGDRRKVTHENGAVIRFAHVNRMSDAYKYAGLAFSRVVFLGMIFAPVEQYFKSLARSIDEEVDIIYQ